MMFNVIDSVVLERALLDAPEMSFLDDLAREDFERVEKENPTYNCHVLFSFARNWARLMEKAMAQGRPLNNRTIRECERLANTITDGSELAYFYVKTLLADNWKYGHRLQKYN